MPKYAVRCKVTGSVSTVVFADDAMDSIRQALAKFQEARGILRGDRDGVHLTLQLLETDAVVVVIPGSEE